MLDKWYFRVSSWVVCRSVLCQTDAIHSDQGNHARTQLAKIVYTYVYNEHPSDSIVERTVLILYAVYYKVVHSSAQTLTAQYEYMGPKGVS